MLYPDHDDRVDPLVVYGGARRPLPKARPHVLVNMIASLDGQTAIAGKSGALASDADRAVFQALRAISDLILVGGGTIRTENYGPAALSEPVRRMRVGRGQQPLPPIAAVSRRLAFDWGARLFAAGGPRPLIVTAESADEELLAQAEAHADIVMAGTDDIDIVRALEDVRERGYRLVLCEGGPALNRSLLEAGVVDEVALTLAPVIVGGESSRIFEGAAPDLPVGLHLAHVLEEAGYLFLRYVRS